MALLSRHKLRVLVSRIVSFCLSPTEHYNSSNPMLNSDMRLSDQNDLFILDFSPSLETLSKLAVIKHHIDASCLPLTVQRDIEATGERQVISREAANSG